MFRLLLILIICATLNQSYGQVLSGTWVETSKSKFSPLDLFFVWSTEDIMELTVSSDSLLKGVVHSNYSKGRFTHVKVSGIINWKDSTVIIKDIKILDNNFNLKVYNYCYSIEFLTLSISDGTCILSGKRKDLSAGMIRCPTQKVRWVKLLSDSSYHNADLKRTIDIQDLIEVDGDEVDSIKCSIYDNGEIDEDTVSVFFNDSLILSKQELSAKPIEFYITLSKTRKTNIIKMYAENLGKIPPNTAVLIINTRKKRYTVNLESNFSNNGSVQFFLKE